MLANYIAAGGDKSILTRALPLAEVGIVLKPLPKIC